MITMDKNSVKIYDSKVARDVFYCTLSEMHLGRTSVNNRVYKIIDTNLLYIQTLTYRIINA